MQGTPLNSEFSELVKFDDSALSRMHPPNYTGINKELKHTMNMQVCNMMQHVLRHHEDQCAVVVKLIQKARWTLTSQSSHASVLVFFPLAGAIFCMFLPLVDS